MATPTTVHDVAASVLQRTGTISTMKLQKLVYYSQAWHLALAHEPLFDAEIQAWANGPVCKELFNQHRKRFAVSEWPQGNPSHLDEYQSAIVTIVVAKYGAMTGAHLSELSHSETPWRSAREHLPAGAYCTNPISHEVMKTHYGAKGKDELIGTFLH